MGHGYEDDEYEDDGTMPANVAALGEAVIGHRIIQAEWTTDPDGIYDKEKMLVLTLDNGTKVLLHDSGDCCAYTQLENFFAHPEMVDHVITGVRSNENYTRWYVLADMGDVLELAVSWSAGNPFYYTYGFEIEVKPMEALEASNGGK